MKHADFDHRSFAAGAAFRTILSVAILIVGATLAAWGAGWIGELHSPANGIKTDHHQTARWLGAAMLFSSAAFFVIHRRFSANALAAMRQYAHNIDSLSPPARWFDLALVSALGLYLEIVLIRWHGTEFRACAYLKNVSLLACFLGLGLGFARSRREILGMPAMLVLLAAQVLVMDVLSLADADRAIRNPFSGEVYWGMGHMTSAIHVVSFYGFFAALFVSTIVIFIPIGQLTGRLMNPAAPLASYTVNILGSIAGVVAFSLVSYLWLPPPIWFSPVAIAGIWLIRASRCGVVASACAAAAMLAWLGFEPRAGVRDVYSPYQRLEVRSEAFPLNDGSRVMLGTAVSANKTWYMEANDLSDAFVNRWKDRVPPVRAKAAAYNLPYEIGRKPDSVLIVGAGAGNDVAAAIRSGAQRVDAVEIDPAILAIGREAHPESPYQSAKVHAIVTDARNFMRSAPSARYDLIVFGLLDSHTLLSGMTSVRLDNFVYTLESMREARRLLRPGGRVCLSFAVGADTVFAARIFKMLTSAFGHPPRACTLQGTDTSFLIGLDQASIGADGVDVPDSTAIVAASTAKLNPPMATDDWPFPFLAGRRWVDFPRPYAYLIVLLAGISLVWIFGTRESDSQFDGQFFFLGAAFLLVETKGITELALLFGTNWIVTSIIIVSILILILLANWAVATLSIVRTHAAYAFLLASLAAGYLLPIDRLMPYGRVFGGLMAAGLLCLPLIFAGVVFAASLRQCRSLPSAFSSNLVGAILGGLCEYSSMVLGFRNLYLVAAGLYFLAWMCAATRRSLAT